MYMNSRMAVSWMAVAVAVTGFSQGPKISIHFIYSKMEMFKISIIFIYLEIRRRYRTVPVWYNSFHSEHHARPGMLSRK